MSATRALRLASTASRAFVGRTSVVGPRLALASRVSAVAAAAPARAFSVSVRRFGEGTTDVSLAQKLKEEIEYELEDASASKETPAFLKAFLEQGVWSIEDASGNEEVALTRTFGNEQLRLMFSIADVQQEEYEEPESEEGEEAEDVDPIYPIRSSLSITKKSSPGALIVEMTCQGGNFVVENISYYNDGKVATELTADADWKRRGLYMGPSFESLDSTLQEEFDKYLQERGIGDAVAAFIPEYSLHKEQQEYVKWLGGVKSFVDA